MTGPADPPPEQPPEPLADREDELLFEPPAWPAPGAARARILAIGLAFYVVLAGAGLTWMLWRGDELASGLTARDVHPLSAAAAGITAAILVILVSDRLLERFAWTELLRGEVVELLGPFSRTQAVSIGLVSGCAEELFFRGALLPAAGLIVSSVLFGALHSGPRLLGWAIFATFAGFLMGGLFLWSGGLLAPILAHVLINGIQLWRMAGPAGT